jgi:sodium/pantothenate symporter
MTALGSFLIYSLVLIGIGIYTYRAIRETKADKFVEEFYAGGRGLGALVIALLIAAGMASAGTFIAGPGMCYEYGLSWVHLNNLQMFMNLMLLGVIGIPVGISARRVKAATFLDLIKARYENRTIVILLAILTFVLLVPYMSTQFVGAARVIAQMTGVNYMTGLLLGAVVVIVYTVAGGM